MPAARADPRSERGHRRSPRWWRHAAPLDEKVREVEERFAGTDIPAPPFWGGYRIRPDVVEFWQGRTDRLHDRFRYRRVDDGWAIERLAP